MRKDAGTYGDAQRIEQLGWMLFLKIYDDREREFELLQDGYRSPLAEELRWRSWATDSHPAAAAADAARTSAERQEARLLCQVRWKGQGGNGGAVS